MKVLSRGVFLEKTCQTPDLFLGLKQPLRGDYLLWPRQFPPWTKGVEANSRPITQRKMPWNSVKLNSVDSTCNQLQDPYVSSWRLLIVFFAYSKKSCWELKEGYWGLVCNRSFTLLKSRTLVTAFLAAKSSKSFCKILWPWKRTVAKKARQFRR